MNAKIYNGNVQPNPKEFKIWVNDEGLIKTWNGTKWVESSGGSGSGSSDGVKWEYYKIDWDKFDEINDYESLFHLVSEADAFNVSYWGAEHVTTCIGEAFTDYTYSKIAGTNKAMFDISNLDDYAYEANKGSWIKNIQVMYPNINISFIVPITKDEFLIFDDNSYRSIVNPNGPV